MKTENELAYKELLKRYRSLKFWGVYNAMSDDGYDPNCDYTVMLFALNLKEVTPAASASSENDSVVAARKSEKSLARERGDTQ